MAESKHSTSLLDTTALAATQRARVAIVFTEWNEKIVGEQIAGAERILQQHGAILTGKYAVPGSFELPFACRHIYETTKRKDNAPEAIIAFGAVIRGGTPHFEYVCKAVTEGITQLNVTLPVPVIFGVLTLDTVEQAWERLGGPHGHKGEEAAITALKMIQFTRNNQ
ncbi:MAG: 6,7-dimethyl-8-ribityllumazine synthase [Taibaiella sp.]|nr:6,7-dimethyl-8-ribityllumazine synthase [Taibaiella sp.]